MVGRLQIRGVSRALDCGTTYEPVCMIINFGKLHKEILIKQSAIFYY